MKKVLIVDDSPVLQQLMAHIIAMDPALEVAGIVNNGEEALEFVRKNKPDVITMDIHMPKMDGYETTRRIMEEFPTPIVIVTSSVGVKEMVYTFRLLEAGALAVIHRPPFFDNKNYKIEVHQLVETIKLMSEVKVVGRKNVFKRALILPQVQPVQKGTNRIELIAIGASTGGPQVLQTLLSRLPHNLPVPVLIVQHIAKGFLEGFVDWMSGAILLKVQIGAQGEKLLPGHCYIAPDNCNMGVSKDLKIILDYNGSAGGHRPSVAHLFHSVALAFGPRSAGVLLSGMGKDGAMELKEMKDRGALTIIQDEASCIVFGMPGEAKKLGAETYALPPEQIADSLSALFNKVNGGGK